VEGEGALAFRINNSWYNGAHSISFIGVLVPIGTRHPLKNTRQDQMSDITQFRAKTGEAITIQNGKLHVPNNPVVPYVEGDGTLPIFGARVCGFLMRLSPKPGQRRTQN
jgi:hypothetical protein